MDHYVEIKVRPKTAAILLITGELDANDSGLVRNADQVLDELNCLTVDELLELVDNHTYCVSALVGECPHFGKLEILLDVPKKILENGHCSYAQLGVLLKGHAQDSYDSNRKYGEFYGKTASFLGLVRLETDDCENGFSPSSLTTAFCNKDYQTKEMLVQKLSFRVNSIQILLRNARFHRINGYDVFKDGTMSTRRKKKEGINHLLDYMKRLGNSSLDQRLGEIYWEESSCN